MRFVLLYGPEPISLDECCDPRLVETAFLVEIAGIPCIIRLDQSASVPLTMTLSTISLNLSPRLYLL